MDSMLYFNKKKLDLANETLYLWHGWSWQRGF